MAVRLRMQRRRPSAAGPGMQTVLKSQSASQMKTSWMDWDFRQVFWGVSFLKTATGQHSGLIPQLLAQCLTHTKYSIKCFLSCCAVPSHFSHVWLFANLWTIAHQAPLVHGILQAGILEWVAMPSSRRCSWPKDWTRTSYVSCIGRQVLYHWVNWRQKEKGVVEN